jgi:hypothetical protein
LQNLAHEILRGGKLTGDQSPNSGVLGGVVSWSPSEFNGLQLLPCPAETRPVGAEIAAGRAVVFVKERTKSTLHHFAMDMANDPEADESIKKNPTGEPGA